MIYAHRTHDSRPLLNVLILRARVPGRQVRVIGFKSIWKGNVSSLVVVVVYSSPERCTSERGAGRAKAIKSVAGASISGNFTLTFTANFSARDHHHRLSFILLINVALDNFLQIH